MGWVTRAAHHPRGSARKLHNTQMKGSNVSTLPNGYTAHTWAGMARYKRSMARNSLFGAGSWRLIAISAVSFPRAAISQVCFFEVGV